MMKRGSFLLCLLTFGIAALFAEETQALGFLDDYASLHLRIENDFFTGYTIANATAKYPIGLFGMPLELEKILVQSQNVAQIIKNVNPNMDAGTVVSIGFGGFSGYLFAQAIFQDTNDKRYGYILGGLGSLLVGEIIATIFYSSTYNDLGLAVDAYNANLLKP